MPVCRHSLLYIATHNSSWIGSALRRGRSGCRYVSDSSVFNPRVSSWKGQLEPHTPRRLLHRYSERTCDVFPFRIGVPNNGSKNLSCSHDSCLRRYLYFTAIPCISEIAKLDYYKLHSLRSPPVWSGRPQNTEEIAIQGIRKYKQPSQCYCHWPVGCPRSPLLL